MQILFENRSAILLAVLALITPCARAATLVVTTTADSGAGSLRQSVASANPGDTITFGTSLAGQAIGLTSGAIVLSNNITIDGSSLAVPVQINGSHNSRIFTVTNGATVLLSSLVITNGYASYDGGGIENNGILTITNVTVTGNEVVDPGNGALGGGIVDYTKLTIWNSAVVGNLAYSRYDYMVPGYGASGGGIAEFGVGVINNTTIANNQAIEYGVGHGGGIDDENVLILNNSTVANNLAEAITGGIDNQNAASLVLTNTIVCSNTNQEFLNPAYESDYTAPYPLTSANSLYYTNAMLAPLGYYGGPTMTMPPLPGSPAIDAGSDTVTSFLAIDQRGFARKNGAHVDIGAVETQVIMAARPLQLIPPTKWSNGPYKFTFTNNTGASLTVWAATNLALPFNQWSNLGTPTETPVGNFSFTDPQTTNNVRRFYRVSSP